MQLTEQHIIYNNEWKGWCVKAKNLYNQSLYYWRQSMFRNIEYFSEYELLKLFREFKEENYIQLPSHCGQEVIKNLFKNVKCWQRTRKEYRKNPKKFLGKPKMPKYKKELSILSFNNCQVKLKNGYIHFPKMIGVAPMKTKIPNGTKLGTCRVIPKKSYFVVEFIYEKQEQPIKDYNGKSLGVDLGMNNLASCLTNTGHSFIINGKPIKSINQIYNKKRANISSILPLLPKINKSKTGNRIQYKTSNKIEKLTLNRNNKIKNYIHHASKFIVEKAKELDITKIIIGNNKQWKTEINLGSRTNQNFVSIPFATLITQIEYKAKLEGIEAIVTEESYTSKCSFIDLEPICKHEKYVGKRKKRGLFVTAQGKLINADCNGAGNIIRKVIKDLEINDLILRAVIAPKKLLPFKQKVV